MPRTILLPNANTDDASIDITNAPGELKTITITGRGRILVEMKTDNAGGYTCIGELASHNPGQAAFGISMPITFRVRRQHDPRDNAGDRGAVMEN